MAMIRNTFKKVGIDLCLTLLNGMMVKWYDFNSTDIHLSDAASSPLRCSQSVDMWDKIKYDRHIIASVPQIT